MGCPMVCMIPSTKGCIHHMLIHLPSPLEYGVGDQPTGVPPLGVKGYSCTGVYDNICFFGGMCCHWPLEGICNGYQ